MRIINIIKAQKRYETLGEIIKEFRGLQECLSVYNAASENIKHDDSVGCIEEIDNLIMKEIKKLNKQRDELEVWTTEEKHITYHHEGGSEK